jgi:hypothetical protein
MKIALCMFVSENLFKSQLYINQSHNLTLFLEQTFILFGWIRDCLVFCKMSYIVNLEYERLAAIEGDRCLLNHITLGQGVSRTKAYSCLPGIEIRKFHHHAWAVLHVNNFMACRSELIGKQPGEYSGIRGQGLYR